MAANASTLLRDEIDEERTVEVDEQWRQSLLDVMRHVIHSLPDQTSLGELVAATRANPHLAPTLGYMSVQELIDMAVARPTHANGEAKKLSSLASNGAPARRRPEPEIQFDEEGNPIMDLPDSGPAVIRRRADVPDGDYRILRTLADEGPLGEGSLVRATKLTSEQLKLVLRHLRTKGWIHVEGTGPKRKVKITRNGASHLRKLSRKHGIR
jgi:predicted transcriptional regulator